MENLIFDFISRHMPLSETEKQAKNDLSIFRAYRKGTVQLHSEEYSRDGYFVLTGCLRSYYLIDG